MCTLPILFLILTATVGLKLKTLMHTWQPPCSLMVSKVDVSLTSPASFRETPLNGLPFILQCFAEICEDIADNLSWKLIHIGDSGQYSDRYFLNSVALGTLLTVHTGTSTLSA